MRKILRFSRIISGVCKNELEVIIFTYAKYMITLHGRIRRTSNFRTTIIMSPVPETQFPLAFAVTFHKVRGLRLERAVVDWRSGQTDANLANLRCIH